MKFLVVAAALAAFFIASTPVLANSCDLSALNLSVTTRHLSLTQRADWVDLNPTEIDTFKRSQNIEHIPVSLVRVFRSEFQPTYAVVTAVTNEHSPCIKVLNGKAAILYTPKQFEELMEKSWEELGSA